eukprot:20125-Heterococcus_DN1.PRE.2
MKGSSPARGAFLRYVLLRTSGCCIVCNRTTADRRTQLWYHSVMSASACKYYRETFIQGDSRCQTLSSKQHTTQQCRRSRDTLSTRIPRNGHSVDPQLLKVLSAESCLARTIAVNGPYTQLLDGACCVPPDCCAVSYAPLMLLLQCVCMLLVYTHCKQSYLLALISMLSSAMLVHVYMLTEHASKPAESA